MINNNSFILINSRGCVKCEKQTFYFLIKNIDLLSNYKIIVSANFLTNIEYNKPIPKNIIIDHLNKLESTTLPVNGISILEFKNKVIIGTRSINPLYLQTHSLKEFFNITDCEYQRECKYLNPTQGIWCDNCFRGDSLEQSVCWPNRPTFKICTKRIDSFNWAAY
jgi:hypothetical protein